MIIVIAGATGSGKSDLAFKLAEKVDGEIINADAFQVYEELNIATAKPPISMREKLPHHLFDFVPISDEYNVYRYQQDSRREIDDILSRGKTPIIAGGTGLYIRASLFDYEFGETKEIDMSEFDGFSNEQLFEKLKEIDPEEANKIHPNNRVRMLRAIEIYLSTGTPKSKHVNAQKHEPIFDVRFFGLKPEREDLYRVVEERVDRMFDAGLVEENKGLIEKYGRTPRAFNAIGVKELFPYFDGKKSLEECKEDIKKATRHYVKRQDTFFAHQFEIKWISSIKDILSSL